MRTREKMPGQSRLFLVVQRAARTDFVVSVLLCITGTFQYMRMLHQPFPAWCILTYTKESPSVLKVLCTLIKFGLVSFSVSCLSQSAPCPTLGHTLCQRMHGARHL